MGMFDYIRCEYPLPGNPDVRGAWQTKDTPDQSMDTYVIDKDGRLWYEDYDIEDRSDPNATDWRAAAGCMARVNERLVATEYRGCIVFYGSDAADKHWEFSALFDKGKLLSIEQVE